MPAASAIHTTTPNCINRFIALIPVTRGFPLRSKIPNSREPRRAVRKLFECVESFFGRFRADDEKRVKFFRRGQTPLRQFLPRPPPPVRSSHLFRCETGFSNIHPRVESAIESGSEIREFDLARPQTDRAVCVPATIASTASESRSASIAATE
jgi:hypothetical protein